MRSIGDTLRPLCVVSVCFFHECEDSVIYSKLYFSLHTNDAPLEQCEIRFLVTNWSSQLRINCCSIGPSKTEISMFNNMALGANSLRFPFSAQFVFFFSGFFSFYFISSLLFFWQSQPLTHTHSHRHIDKIKFAWALSVALVQCYVADIHKEWHKRIFFNISASISMNTKIIPHKTFPLPTSPVWPSQSHTNANAMKYWWHTATLR